MYVYVRKYLVLLAPEPTAAAVLARKSAAAIITRYEYKYARVPTSDTAAVLNTNAPFLCLILLSSTMLPVVVETTTTMHYPGMHDFT